MKHPMKLCFLCATALLLSGCSSTDSQQTDSADVPVKTTEAATDTTAAEETAPHTTKTLPVQSADPVDVGGADSAPQLTKPAMLGQSEVFLGFAEQDTVAQIADLPEGQAVTLTPESVSLEELHNTVYADAVYVSGEKDTAFSVPVVIGGKTDFSLVELEIRYDKDAFAFERFEDTDADAVCNCNEEAGAVYISFTCTENVQADVGLTTLCFRTKTDQQIDSALQFTVRDIAKWNPDRTTYEDVPFETAGGRIVTY